MSTSNTRARAESAVGLCLRLLGPPKIQLGGTELPLRDLKAQALLFYLAATGEACARERLATLLWSESPESNARHSLRSGLYHLRHALASAGLPDVIVAEHTLVRLSLPDEACDIARFHRLIASDGEHEVVEGVALYQGTLLEGFALPDAPVFEEWLRSARDAFGQAYLHALDRLAAWAEGRAAWEEAIGHMERMVRADPLNEAAQQRLLRLHLRTGATVPALRQYQRFESELKRELGLDPSPETQALLQHALRSRSGSMPPAAASTIPPARPVASTRRAGWGGGDVSMPLVGRDDLLAQMLAASQRPLLSGHGTTLLLQGETGMGKTRLLEELAAALSAQSPPWLVLRGSCSPFDELLAFGPFYEALQTATPGDLTELLGGARDDGQAEPGAITWRVLRALRLLAQSGPLLLAIDDLQWANSSTLHLFGFLSAHLRHIPLLLVGTIERPDAIPAVQRLLALGRTRGEAQLVSVPPLTPDAATALLRALGLSPDAATSLGEWLQARSAGSPFMIGEILAQLRTDGAVAQAESGDWHLNEARWLRRRVSFSLPETTYDLVAWRLAALDPAARHLLDVLAVAGQPLPFALLRDLPGIQGDHALQMIDDLLGRRLLVEITGESFDLPHHLLRQALLARQSQLRRRTIHRQLLDALERCPALQAQFPLRQVALHAVAAEDADRARHYGLRVLDALLRETPSAETLGFALDLHDLLAPTASSDERLRLTAALGQLHQALGQLEAAARWRSQQLDIAHGAGDLAAQVSAHFELAELALVSSDYQAAVAAARAGLAMCETIEEQVRVAMAGRGSRLLGAALAMEGRDLLTAERYLHQAAEAHRAAGDAGDLCAALFELGNIAAQRGDLDRALAHYEEAGQAGEAGHVPYYQALAQNNLAYHSMLLGRIEVAQQAAADGRRVAEMHELAGALLHLYSTLGEIRLYLAEWARAAEWFERGLALAEELGNVERQAGFRAGLALAARGGGDLERADVSLREAFTLIDGQGHWHLRTRLQLWLAELSLLRGQTADAVPWLEDALATARTQERALLLIHGERLRARLLAAAGQWAEANALFAGALKRAADLGLALEAARTRAAWGEELLRVAPSSRRGHQLVAAAHETFAACHAAADLAAMRTLVRP